MRKTCLWGRGLIFLVMSMQKQALCAALGLVSFLAEGVRKGEGVRNVPETELVEG